jgi:cytochrome c oxidase subunit IV
MGHGKDIGYSIPRIFWILFGLTALEVAWGKWLREPEWFLWAGLLICALIKGLLIFMYFMHMRFERFVVWALILPTPLLVAIVLFANMPDTVFNAQKRDHPVGYLIDQSGEVVNALDPHKPALGRGLPHGFSKEHPASSGPGDGAKTETQQPESGH